jgi:hypothetical protein
MRWVENIDDVFANHGRLYDVAYFVKVFVHLFILGRSLSLSAEPLRVRT